MTIYFTAITPSHASQHTHIAGVRWLDSDRSISKTMTTSEAIQWLRQGYTALVAGDERAAQVHVVEATMPYLRTVADGNYTDNLLSLPRY